jgi:hypothetical protein
MSEILAQSLFSWEDRAGNTNTLDVDVVMNSNDKRTAKLTDHVVESGAVITDHVIINPATVTFDLLVTQTPLPGPGMRQQSSSITASGQKLSPATYPIKIPPSQFQPGGFLLLSTGLRTVVNAAADAVLGLVGLGSGSENQMTGSKIEQISQTVQVTTLQAESDSDRIGAVHDKLVEILTNVFLVTVSFKGRLYRDYLLTSVELESKAGMAGCATFKVEARAFDTVTGTSVQLPDPADFRAKAAVNKGNKSTKTPDPDPS